MGRDIREQFGLDFLRNARRSSSGAERSSSSGPEQSLPPFMERALLSYGRPLLQSLLKQHGRGRVFELIDLLGVDVETLMPVINYLVSNGYLEKREEDKRGNHELQITPAGERLLG